jgi:flavin reductase (DIM6/NTAB) family NADH-FMN oxidoreductase RutF
VIRLDPADLPELHCYKLLTGLMVPRPVAFVSTLSEDGVVNAAPFSWNTVACIAPPILAFTPGRAPGRPDLKLDTLRNVELTGEFVSNVVTSDIEQRMVECSRAWAPDVDELAETGLTAVASDVVAAPRIAESRASFECTVERVLRMGDGDGTLVLGRVVRIHLHPDVFSGGRLDLAAAGHTGRMGGTEYARTQDTFRLRDLRPAGDVAAPTEYAYE